VGRGGRGPGIAARPKGGPDLGLRFRWGFRRPKRWRKKAVFKASKASFKRPTLFLNGKTACRLPQ
jgi:hypothetical protein